MRSKDWPPSMSRANTLVERRLARRDRRLHGDRRSNVLPNLTDHSRRVAIRDRRSGSDRRAQVRATATPHLVSTLPIY